MPYVKNGNAEVYFEDVGHGEPIITTHGVAENGGYWRESGVTARLVEGHRVISMDMRGHGATKTDLQEPGFDAETMTADIDALADHLGLERFHLLTHATGGMVGVRYAMERSDRLASLALTDTGSATLPRFPNMDTDQTKVALGRWADSFAQATHDQVAANARVSPGPFLFRMAQLPEHERMFAIWERVLRRNDLKTVASFLRSFYTDPDPRVDGLHLIACPTLVLLGEHDVVFLEPSALMAREIPDVRYVVLPGVGHMTAIEDTESTVTALRDFLDCVSKTGHAAIPG